MELLQSKDCVIKMSDVDKDGAQLPSVSDVNCHLICSVCRGYLVDATTITECLHSFCRSCVVPHVTEFHECPSCCVPLSSTKPFSQLRRDYTLQSIVYKMVPSLARNELERRKQFAQSPINSNRFELNKSEECYLQSFFAANDPISMSLEYAEPNCQFGLKRNNQLASSMDVDGSSLYRRYYRCPADLPIGHLMKFLRCKFNIIDANRHKLEILYNGRPLAAEYKLSDVAYIFSWKEREPLRLWFRIHPADQEETVATVKPVEQTKSKKRASLVDITIRRQSNRNEPTPRKRRKTSVKVAPIDAISPSNCDDEESRHPTCSTPIPSDNASAPDRTNKIGNNWLPKAVFDLDDRNLFAEKLSRISSSSAANRPEELTPLRICCVTPDAAIRDSTGALDLSGSHKSCDSSPLSSGSCRSNDATPPKIGPHPYFMTPSAVYHHVRQQDPAQSMAALTAVAAHLHTDETTTKLDDAVPKKVPIWDLLIRQRPTDLNPMKKTNSLLSLLKSNSILFRPKNNNNNNNNQDDGQDGKLKQSVISSPHSA